MKTTHDVEVYVFHHLDDEPNERIRPGTLTFDGNSLHLTVEYKAVTHTYLGWQESEGHYKLKNVDEYYKTERCTLHGFPNSTLWVGHWEDVAEADESKKTTGVWDVRIKKNL